MRIIEDLGESPRTVQGFNLSTEMVYGRPFLKILKYFSPDSKIEKGPSYGFCSGRRTPSCRTNTIVAERRSLGRYGTEEFELWLEGTAR